VFLLNRQVRSPAPVFEGTVVEVGVVAEVAGSEVEEATNSTQKGPLVRGISCAFVWFRGSF
jgi:hypothetical protein